ncbi:MAG: hypothetical protein ACE5JM_11460 [Armatimonadota bacterium]
MHRCILGGPMLAALLVGLLLPDALLAQEGKGPVPAEISVNNYLFLRIRTPAAGFTVDQRRVLLEQRLTEIFSNENTRQPDVRVGNIRGKPTIYVGETQLITVYPRDADANKTTMERLAAHWAKRLRIGIAHVGPVRSLKPPPEQ